MVLIKRRSFPLPGPPRSQISRGDQSSHVDEDHNRKARRIANAPALTIVLVILSCLTVWMLLPGDGHRATPSRPAQKRRLECAEHLRDYPRCPNRRYLPTALVGNASKSFACDFDTSNDLEYLPDVDFLRCARDLARTPLLTTWKRNFDLMRRRADYLQTPDECGRPRGIFKFRGGGDDGGGSEKKHWHLVKFGPHGHGALVMAVIHTVGSHWDRGMPVLASTNRYRFTDEACGTGWTCHLTPLSSVCDLERTPLDAVLHTSMRVARSFTTLSNYCSVSVGERGGVFNVTYGRCSCPNGTMPSNVEMFNGCRPVDTDTPEYEHDVWKDLEPDIRSGLVDVMTSTDNFFSDAAPGELFLAGIAPDDIAASKLQNGLSNKHYSIDSEEAKRLGLTRIFSEGDNIVTSSELVADMENQPKHTLGFLWWWSHVAYLLHHPSNNDGEDETGKKLPIKRGWLPPRKCIAVHIRRGDSCKDEGAPMKKCPPVSVFNSAIEKLSSLYGRPDYVYVASDDDQVLRELQEMRKDLSFRWQDISRAKYTEGIAIDNHRALENSATLDELYHDIHQMVRCESIVGAWSSGLMLLTYGLMAGRKGYYPPFISVELSPAHATPILDVYDNVDARLDGR